MLPALVALPYRRSLASEVIQKEDAQDRGMFLMSLCEAVACPPPSFMDQFPSRHQLDTPSGALYMRERELAAAAASCS